MNHVRTNLVNNSTSGSPWSYALTTGYTSGDTAVVSIMTTTATVTSMTDTLGNVYTKLTGALNVSGLTTFVAQNLIGGSTTLTVTASGAGLQNLIVVEEYSGVTSTLDVSATQTAASGGAFTVGPTSATAQAVELALAVFAGIGSTSAATWSTPAGYTARGTESVMEAANNFYTLTVFELITTATGTQSAASTLAPAGVDLVGILDVLMGPASGSGRVPNVPTLTNLPGVVGL